MTAVHDTDLARTLQGLLWHFEALHRYVADFVTILNREATAVRRRCLPMLTAAEQIVTLLHGAVRTGDRAAVTVDAACQLSELVVHLHSTRSAVGDEQLAGRCTDLLAQCEAARREMQRVGPLR